MAVKIKRALTIAGSDSGGGAGIQADLKTFCAMGVYGMSVITAITAQNTLGVQAAYELPLRHIAAQIDSVLTDIGVDAAKTGMLSSARVVQLVARKVKEYGIENLVVDPVMAAKSGDLLLAEDARASLRDLLLPLAKVVTPNIPEASVLTGVTIESVEQMKRAARHLHEMGAQWIVVKGGHLAPSEDAIDLVFDGRDFQELRTPRIPTKNTHGTGCTFSAAIAAGLAQSLPTLEAIAKAKRYVTRAIAQALELGKGMGPTNHLVDMKSPWTS
jgi:hydroxymethylpyrimidine/phosphomethylpyrimidine kinase